MYNCSSISFDEFGQQQFYTHSNSWDLTSRPHSTNKFVYVKQNFTNQSSTVSASVRVLVNPNFNKKVFVNPNFHGYSKNITPSVPLPKIHVNPNAQNFQLGVADMNTYKNINKIHVNPNVLKNLPISISGAGLGENLNKNPETTCIPEKTVACTVISTKTKIVRSMAKNTSDSTIKKRRSSIKSQFKIIKSSLLEKMVDNENKLKSKYKLHKAGVSYTNHFNGSKLGMNKFKLDNRSTKPMNVGIKNRKYVYVNKFLSISDIARNNLLKQNRNKLCVVNIGEVIYKKSPNSLKKTSNPYKKTNDAKKTVGNAICKSKYKFMRKMINNSAISNQSLKQPKTLRLKRVSVGKNASKLRVCNIPCPYYRKFGRCKGKENGKCFRKHDPDQIALCTKFLQGACIDKKCLLSHNVSPEKMPTCKFYLEGSCSRDDCPYLHVRISPKADICKDFLEGFCKKAAECDKRHQFLCPDYEKNDNCLKQRCPYPHGKMVRKYSVFCKNKFAKKSSYDYATKSKVNYKAEIIHSIPSIKSKNVKPEGSEGNFKSRYYIGQNNNLNNEQKNQIPDTITNDPIDCLVSQELNVKSRPKLGTLPSFIAFENM